MDGNITHRDIVGNLFLNLIAWEGKHFDKVCDESFIKTIYSGTDVCLPTLTDIVGDKTVLPWKALKTGDLAVFSNGESSFLGLVMGEIERQFAFVDPTTSIVQITYYDERIDGYNYINGIKVISNASK